MIYVIENKLPVSFGDSLKSDAISCVSDLAEVGLDAIMDEGLLKDVPFISTAISLYNIGKNLNERHYVKKLAIFLNSINNDIADENKREEYIKKFQNNTKFRNKELEYVLVLIDRYISYEKPQMLAKLYLAYLDGVIIWEELTMYAEVIDRFILLDSNMLLSADGTVTVHRNIGGESVLRLVALGLMTETTQHSAFTPHGDGRYGITMGGIRQSLSLDRVYIRTEFGNKLAQILK